MKITKQRLKEIITEELNEASNPEWDKADQILSDLVYLAEFLENSTNAEPGALASAIVSKLREAVDAMERRLNEKFAEVEDEVSDEEALHLKGNPSQRETDRLRRKLKYGFEDWRK